jgi:hypothetical protein
MEPGAHMPHLTEALRQEAERVAPLPTPDRLLIEHDAQHLETLAADQIPNAFLFQRAAAHLRTLLARQP